MDDLSKLVITAENKDNWEGKRGSEPVMAGLDGGFMSEGFYNSQVEYFSRVYCGRRMPRRIQAFCVGGFKPTHEEVWTWHVARSYRSEGTYYLEKSDLHIEPLAQEGESA